MKSFSPCWRSTLARRSRRRSCASCTSSASRRAWEHNMRWNGRIAVKKALLGLVLLLLPLAFVAVACGEDAENELQQQIEELRENIQSTVGDIEEEVEDLRQRAENATQEDRRDIEEQIDR